MWERVLTICVQTSISFDHSSMGEGVNCWPCYAACVKCLTYMYSYSRPTEGGASSSAHPRGGGGGRGQAVRSKCNTFISARLAYILPGLIICTYSLLLDVTSLALLMSLALISVHLVTSACALSEHYRPHDYRPRDSRSLLSRTSSSTSRKKGGIHHQQARGVRRDVLDVSLYGTTACRLEDASATAFGDVTIPADVNLDEAPGGGTDAAIAPYDTSSTNLTAAQRRLPEVLPDVVMYEAGVQFDSFVAESDGHGGYREQHAVNVTTVCGSLDDGCRYNNDDVNDDSDDDKSSSDTDMDDIFDEYHEQQASASVASIYGGDMDCDDRLLNPRCPSEMTHRQAVISLVMFCAVSMAIFFVGRFALCEVSPSADASSHPYRVIFITLSIVFSLIAVAILVHLLRLPQNEVGFRVFADSTSSRGSGRSSGDQRRSSWLRFTPCLRLVAILLSCCIVVFVDCSTIVIYAVSIAPGLFNISRINY